jgi:hypothetical protein
MHGLFLVLIHACQFSFYLLYFNNIDHYKNIIIIKHYKNIIVIKEEHRKPIFTCIKIYSDLRKAEFNYFDIAWDSLF